MATGERSWTDAVRELRRRLDAPIDPASIALYRIAFGTLMAVSSIRYLAMGWVERSYVAPRYFFHFHGFEWVEPLPEPGMSATYVVLAILASLVAVGLFYRFATAAFFLLFTYVELIDVTNYLNHYYLVSLLALLLVFVPANAAFSLDARFGWARPAGRVAARSLYLLRFQVAVVYIGAALAKVEPDWLLHGQPLAIWMRSHAEMPIIGPLFRSSVVTLAMSWAGFLNDLLAVPLLLNRRTRPYAFAMIAVFHGATNMFFNIGIFPILMPINATLFFDPDWPRRFLPSRFRASPVPGSPPRANRFLVALAVVHCVLQVALPLRTHLYPGSVLWHEQGMRFSWRVMLRRKTGSTTYLVRLPSLGRVFYVNPRKYLTDVQDQEFATQPDMILALAHYIAEDYRLRGHPDVEVRADSLVSLNGRAPARLIDPTVDLAKVEDGFGRATYILPGPTSPPPELRSP